MKSLIFLLMWGPVVPPMTGNTPTNRPECGDASSDQFFFPEGSIGERAARFDEDQFVRHWYSQHLRAMSEPSLSCKEPAGEVYRFLWLRTWGRPTTVRIEVLKGGATISAIELDGAGGYEPGKVSRRFERKLTEGEWTQVAEGLRGIDFWTAPTRVRNNGLDGAQWIMEGRKGSQYHVVDRWSPKSGAYRDFCLSLLKFGGLSPGQGTGKRDAIY